MIQDIEPLGLVLHTMRKCASSDIEHVLEIDSGKVGAHVAILACTHGNEPVGLAAIDYLTSDLQLTSGKLYFLSLIHI